MLSMPDVPTRPVFRFWSVILPMVHHLQIRRSNIAEECLVRSKLCRAEGRTKNPPKVEQITYTKVRAFRL
jgi:hypothetical protein